MFRCAGSPDSPVKNVRIVIRSRASHLYNYAQGWATFYADNGVRCGEGLWKVEALAPDEQAEGPTDGTPGGGNGKGVIDAEFEEAK